MLYQYAAVLVTLLGAFSIVPLTLAVGAVLRPSHPYHSKRTSYECGEIPVGSSWVRFNIRFYMIAIVFLIFDVEVLFMFPIAIRFKEWAARGDGFRILFEMMLFILILLVGLAYVWKKGDLEWIRSYRATQKGRHGKQQSN